MKYTSPIHRVLLATGALAIITAPTASADPDPTAAIMTPAESTTPAGTPTLDPSMSTRPETTNATPTPTSAVQTTTTASATPSSVTSAAPTTTPAGPGALRVDTGEFVVAGPTQVGGVVPGTVQVTVTDTRPDSTGWTADVKVTDAHGTHGNTFSPAPGSYYQARSTRCSESAGQVPLGGGTVVVATASTACPAATWTSDIGIVVPADASPDNYTITVTHSVY